jgi:hypothetical protein
LFLPNGPILKPPLENAKNSQKTLNNPKKTIKNLSKNTLKKYKKSAKNPFEIQ